MPRGGYQKPSKPAAASGPGRFSKRTDGGPQPVREPDIDRPDLEYGDRQFLSAAQQVAPVPRGQGARVPTRMQGEAPTMGRIPSFVFGGDSNFPGEPITAGLDMGSGPGHEALAAPPTPEDVREVVLEYLSGMFANEDAREMLQQLRNDRAARSAAPIPTSPGQPVPEIALPSEEEEELEPDEAPPPAAEQAPGFY